MSDPSPLVFEICTAIDRFQERAPDLSVSEVLAALGEVSWLWPVRVRRSVSHDRML